MTNPVEAQIVRMMMAYPSLYATRADALKELFSSHYVVWRDGSLVYENEAFTLHRSLPVLLDEEETVEKNMRGWRDMDEEFVRRREARERLRVRRENAELVFVLENAELLAAEPNSNLSHAPREEYPHFDDMPENVAPEWLEAARELALTVVSYEMGGGYYRQSSDEQARVKVRIEAAKLRCKAFLERFKAGGADRSRGERLAALRREAAALGVEIVGQ